jgi:glycosyltransferase involved in cell wall biosynthesis
MRNSVPEVSVVIPARDAEDSLPRLLSSLARQTLARDRFEIVVVENGSRDRTAEVAERAGARVLRERVGNRSRARNVGVTAAKADLLAFTDADCVASSSWLERLLACRGRAPLVAGSVVVSTAPSPNAVERFESLWRFSQSAWVQQGWAATANLCVERFAFDAIGGFDPAYRHIGEDADFCLRAGRAGLALVYCEDAVVTHDAERELGPLLRRAFFHGYSSAQVLSRLGVGHAAWRDLRPLVSPKSALARLGIASDALAPGERRSLGALASVTHATRMAGSVWALARARAGREAAAR